MRRVWLSIENDNLAQERMVRKCLDWGERGGEAQEKGMQRVVWAAYGGPCRTGRQTQNMAAKGQGQSVEAKIARARRRTEVRCEPDTRNTERQQQGKGVSSLASSELSTPGDAHPPLSQPTDHNSTHSHSD